MNASCSNTLNWRVQTISNPNYPLNYVQNSSCTWKFLAPEGMRLRLDSFSYRMEKDDYLNVYEGITDDGYTYNSITQLSGDGRTNGIQSGSRLFLRFSTKSRTVDTGFRIQYSVTGT